LLVTFDQLAPLGVVIRSHFMAGLDGSFLCWAKLVVVIRGCVQGGKRESTKTHKDTDINFLSR
jgi:hypothetical protein